MNETAIVRPATVAGVVIFEKAPRAAVAVKTARFCLRATAMVTPFELSRPILVATLGAWNWNDAVPSEMFLSVTVTGVPVSFGPDSWIVALTVSPCCSNAMSSTVEGSGGGVGGGGGGGVAVVVGRTVASGSPAVTSTTASRAPATASRASAPMRACRRLLERSGRTGVVAGVGTGGGGSVVLSKRVGTSRESGGSGGAGVVGESEGQGAVVRPWAEEPRLAAPPRAEQRDHDLLELVPGLCGAPRPKLGILLEHALEPGRESFVEVGVE